MVLIVKITYNLNDSSQLRLARHPPIQVSVYDDAESSQESPKRVSSSSNKGLVGRFAELPLSVCVSAVKSARYVDKEMELRISLTIPV